MIDISKINPGDTVTVEMVATSAGLEGVYAEGATGRPHRLVMGEIKSHTPAPEPEFDWDTAVAGMCFNDIRDGGYLWFIQHDWATDEYVCVSLHNNFSDAGIVRKEYLTRADAKHDVGPAKEGE